MASPKKKKELKRDIKKNIKEVYGEIEKMRTVSLKKALKGLRELKRNVG